MVHLVSRLASKNTLMKKSILLIILISVISSNDLFSQRKYQKLFDKSIKAGRSYNSFYKVNIKKNKVVPNEKITQYANKYVIRNIKTQNVNRFGDSFDGVESFEFIPKDEINSFIYDNFLKPKLGYQSIDFKKIVSKPTGALYFFNPGESKFYNPSSFHWTGEISNNTIQGKGNGLYIYEKKKQALLAVKGNFVGGTLQGKGTFFFYRYRKVEDFDKGTLKSETINIGEFNDGAAMLTINGKNGFVDKKMNIIIPPKYSKVLEGFNNGKAVVLNNKREEIIIDKSGGFVAYTEKQEQIFEKRRREEAERKRIAVEKEKRKIREEYSRIIDSEDEVKLFTFYSRYKNSKYEFARDYSDIAYNRGALLSHQNLGAFNDAVDYERGRTLVKMLFETWDGSPTAPKLDKIYDFIDSQYSSYGINAGVFGKFTTGRKKKLFVAIRNPVSFMDKAIVNASWYREGTDRKGRWSFTQNSGFDAFIDNVKQFASQNGMKVQVGYYGSMDADIARIEAKAAIARQVQAEMCDECVVAKTKRPSGSNDGTIRMKAGNTYYFDYRDGKYRVSKGIFSSRDTYPDVGSMVRALEQRCRETNCR